MKNDRDSLISDREETGFERERGAAAEPAGELEEPLARGDADILDTERGEARSGKRRLGGRRVDDDRELDQIREPVPELTGAEPDIERELHVGDLEREDVEAEAGSNGLIREAHVGPAALEAQLEPGPAPRPCGGSRAGGRVLRLGQDSGILPPASGCREIRASPDIALLTEGSCGGPRVRGTDHPDVASGRIIERPAGHVDCHRCGA